MTKFLNGLIIVLVAISLLAGIAQLGLRAINDQYAINTCRGLELSASINPNVTNPDDFNRTDCLDAVKHYEEYIF
jgi:hypothetical protein